MWQVVLHLGSASIPVRAWLLPFFLYLSRCNIHRVSPGTLPNRGYLYVRLVVSGSCMLMQALCGNVLPTMGNRFLRMLLGRELRVVSAGRALVGAGVVTVVNITC